MITIYVNEKPVQLEASTNILQLLKHVNSPLKGVAVAIQQNIIPNANWKTQLVNDKDNVLIIQATQGG